VVFCLLQNSDYLGFDFRWAASGPQRGVLAPCAAAPLNPRDAGGPVGGRGSPRGFSARVPWCALCPPRYPSVAYRPTMGDQPLSAPPRPLRRFEANPRLRGSLTQPDARRSAAIHSQTWRQAIYRTRRAGKPGQLVRAI